MSPAVPERHRRVWTEDEDKKLIFGWGHFSLHSIAKSVQRTKWAVSQRARELKLGPFSRGNGISMRAFERYSGFSKEKILAAAKTLNLLFSRIVASDPAHGRPKRAYVISEDQQDLLLQHMLDNPRYFKNEKGSGKTTAGLWGIGKKPKSCRDCKSSDKPHYAKGRCKSCYVGRFKRKKRMHEPIRAFTFKYRFLSNFHPTDVEFEGALYFSVEHAYQAAKTLDLEKRKALQISAGTELSWSPGKAKAWGRRVKIRDDWEDVKLGIMEELLRQKFTRHPDVQKQLLDTGDRELIEGNTWGDRFWGVCDGVGDNHLGLLLMKIRKELREQGA